MLFRSKEVREDGNQCHHCKDGQAEAPGLPRGAVRAKIRSQQLYTLPGWVTWADSLRPQYPCVKGESMISDILTLSRVPREVGTKECDIFLPSLQIISS